MQKLASQQIQEYETWLNWNGYEDNNNNKNKPLFYRTQVWWFE